MSKVDLRACFDNPNPGRDYVIEQVAEKFTSLWPKTGQPDFGTVASRFVAARQCVELKSRKGNLQNFHDKGIF